jgi:arylsulfatase A-like enzyme
VSAQAYWYFYLKGYGLERGWDRLDHSSAPRTISIEGDSYVSGDKLADVAIGELERLARSKARFFFWTHWVDPHSEYVRHDDHDFGSGSRERYDSEVSFVDAAVGRVLDSLDRLGLSDKTVVIITSDHGEAFGEHGMIRHGFEVWEELVRVPLILHVPGAPPGRIDAPRSLIDVAKTILDVFDVSVQGEGDFVRGTSLLKDAFLGKAESPAQRPVLVDMPQGPHNQERRAFIQGGRKLITSSGRTIGIYDLARDPEEKRDLSEDEGLTEELEAEMRGFLAQLRPVPARR